MAARSDTDADRFEETERRLNEWGSECNRNSQALGLPSISGIAQMIAHVRVQERLQKVARRNALRKARKAWKAGDAPIDAKLVAEELGFADPQPTARGKQTQSSTALEPQFSGRVAQVDKVVSMLPGWAKKCIYRSYLYGKPDRIMAEEMHMPPGEYAQRRRAAVYLVADKLDQRYSPALPSGRPNARSAPP